MPPKARRMSTRELFKAMDEGRAPPNPTAVAPPSTPPPAHLLASSQGNTGRSPAEGGSGVATPPGQAKKRRSSVAMATDASRDAAKKTAEATAKSAKKLGKYMKKQWRRRSVMLNFNKKTENETMNPPEIVHHATEEQLAFAENAGSINMRIFLMNNAYQDIMIDGKTLAGEICLKMREVMKVHNDRACSLFEYVHGTYLLIRDEESVLERLQSWTEQDHKSGHCRLVYKVRIHIPEGPFEEEAEEQEDPESGAHRLLYIEAVHRVVAGLYSVTPAQAAVLASLQVQAYSGDSAAEEIGTQYIEDIGVQTLVAQAIIDKVGSADMIDAIAEEHATHQGLNQMEAERQYLQRVKLYCKCYGGLFFAAKEMHQDTGNAVARTLPRDVISSIADDGIHIMSGWNLTNHVFFKYEDITKWTTATDPDLFAFSVNDDMIYFLISDYPRYIEDAVQMYVSSVINRQQGAPLPTRRDSSKLKLTKEEIYGPESTVNWEERISANLHVLLEDDDEEQNDADEGEEEEEGEGEIDDDEDLNMDLSNTNLPEGWEALPDPETGETYYWNEATDETTWDHPNKSAMIAEKKRMRLRMKAMRARRSSAVMVANVSAGGSAEGDIESTSEASPSADTQETSTAAATKTAPKARKKKKGRRASALMAVHMRRSKSNNETTSQDVDDAPTVAGEEEDLSPLPMGGDEEEIEVAEPSQPPPPSSEDLDEFLETLSLSAFADQLRDFGIDHPADLRELVESDLDELGLSKVQRRRLLRKVETL